MTALLVAVFVASLAGSLHCAGMCGAFAACSMALPGERVRPLVAPAAYNLGRLATYVLLGVIAGAVGAAVNTGGAWLGLQRTATLLAGTGMATLGASALLRMAGFRLPRIRAPLVTLRIVRGGCERAVTLRPARRAALIGCISTWLPCGWLYAFALTAAGSGSVAGGVSVMIAFWLGTLPVMLSLAAGIPALAAPLVRRAPWLPSVALILIGIYTASGRWSLPPLAVAAAETRSSIEHVQTLPAATPACCQESTRKGGP
jgi:sulfite exporter TauE/SafE